MKPFQIKILPILLLSIIKLITSKISDTEISEKGKSNEIIIPDIDLRNFDIREKFYECYNPGYDADLIVII